MNLIDILNFAPATLWGFEPDPMSWTGIRVLHLIMIMGVYLCYYVSKKEHERTSK